MEGHVISAPAGCAGAPAGLERRAIAAAGRRSIHVHATPAEVLAEIDERLRELDGWLAASRPDRGWDAAERAPCGPERGAGDADAPPSEDGPPVDPAPIPQPGMDVVDPAAMPPGLPGGVPGGPPAVPRAI